MANNSLTKFANELYTRALEEKKKVSEKLEKEREEVLVKKDRELEAKFRREVERFNSDARNEVWLAVSRREAELSSALRRNRSKAADEVFAEVEKKLAEFTDSEGYREYITREFKAVAAEFSAGVTVCAARACDFKLIKELSPVKNLEMTEAADDIIGGFTLKNTELKIFADCTLKTKLEEQKEQFFEISGLVIE